MAAETSASPADDLLKLAEARFPDLTEAERRLLHAVQVAMPARGGENLKDDDPNNDPSKAEKWGPERSIRTYLLRWLCVDRDAKARVDPQGIWVHAARIEGPLDLAFVTVPFPLIFQRCRLTADADLTEVDIRALYLNGSWVRRINADGAKVKGSVMLREGFHAEGEVRLVGAQIGGNLECDGSTFRNAAREKSNIGGTALQAAGISVAGNVFLRDGFRAEGAVWLIGAQIGGSLQCNGGTFRNPLIETNADSGTALQAARISVTGSVFLRDGFSAEGVVGLLGSQIGGDLNCRRGTFSELNIHSATIKGNFYWSDEPRPKLAKLDLRNASVASIMDDELSWPDPGNLFLDGFVYGRISAGPTGAGERLKWIELQPEFKPQPYRQLAKVLRESGDDDGARYVLYRMEDRRQQEDRSYFLRWFLRVTVGHGYYPLRSLWGLGLISVLGWIIYRRAHLAGAMAPTDKDAYQWSRTNHSPPPHYEGFVPLAYSVENSLPLVQLGQAQRWQPDPNPQSVVLPAGKWIRRVLRLTTSPRFLRGFLWVQIILGWILATLFAAGVSGILRRD